jgi:hypothetical protein
MSIVGTQRGDIIIATAVNNARIFGLGGNDIIECGTGNCNVFTAFGNNVLMSGSSISAHLFAGSGGFFRTGNNIFIGGGGETLMVGGHGNDQFFAGSNNLFDGGGDIMIGGSGANYFDCGPNGNGVILDFNPAKGDTKSPDCRYVITTYQNNIFGPGIPDNITGILSSLNQSGGWSNVFAGPGLFPRQNLGINTNPANNTGVSGLSAAQNLGINTNPANNGGSGYYGHVNYGRSGHISWHPKSPIFCHGNPIVCHPSAGRLGLSPAPANDMGESRGIPVLTAHNQDPSSRYSSANLS